MLKFLIAGGLGFGIGLVSGVIWALPDDFLNRELIKEHHQRTKDQPKEQTTS